MEYSQSKGLTIIIVMHLNNVMYTLYLLLTLSSVLQQLGRCWRGYHMSLVATWQIIKNHIDQQGMSFSCPHQIKCSLRWVGLNHTFFPPLCTHFLCYDIQHTIDTRWVAYTIEPISCSSYSLEFSMIILYHYQSGNYCACIVPPPHHEPKSVIMFRTCVPISFFCVCVCVCLVSILRSTLNHTPLK